MRPNVERALQLADVVKLSAEELEWLTGEADLALAMDQGAGAFSTLPVAGDAGGRGFAGAGSAGATPYCRLR